MTMPALRPRFASRSDRDDRSGVFHHKRVSPGILGFWASDADGIGILPVPAWWDVWDGSQLAEGNGAISASALPPFRTSSRPLRLPDPDRGVVEHGAAVGPAGIGRG